MEQDGYSEACCLGDRNRAVIPRDPARADPIQTFPPTGTLPMACLFQWTIRAFAHECRVVSRPFPYTDRKSLPPFCSICCIPASPDPERGDNPPALSNPPVQDPWSYSHLQRRTEFTLFTEELVWALPRAPQRTQGQCSVPRRWPGGSKVGTSQTRATGGLPG